MHISAKFLFLQVFLLSFSRSLLIHLRKAAAFGFVLGAGHRSDFFFNFDFAGKLSSLVGLANLFKSCERSTRQLLTRIRFVAERTGQSIGLHLIPWREGLVGAGVGGDGGKTVPHLTLRENPPVQHASGGPSPHVSGALAWSAGFLEPLFKPYVKHGPIREYSRQKEVRNCKLTRRMVKRVL